MKIVSISIERPVTVIMVTIALAIFGIVSFFRLQIDLLPDIAYPKITIETRYPDAAPQEVESLVTKPLEEAVGVISHVERITSWSRPGLSEVTLEFLWGTRMDLASLDVREKLDMVLLPDETEEPQILRYDPADEPIMRVGLAGTGDLLHLRTIADEQVKKDLEPVEGVAAVRVNGGLVEEIQVVVDEKRLAPLGLMINGVGEILFRNNIDFSGGSLYEGEARYLVRTLSEFRTVAEIGDIVVYEEAGRRVFMRDIAEVRRGHKDREVIFRIAGREAVELEIRKEGDANTVSVSRAVRKALERIGAGLPEGVKPTVVFDQSGFIERSVRDVISSAAIGGLIAIALLYFFLKDLRSTLLIAVSIPVSIVATIFIMYQLGITMNVMSLGGLALGIGMLVDNSIVVLESITRRRESGAGADAAFTGTSEVGRAVTASTLTTISVFLPISFIQGIAGQLFRDLALTVTSSLLVSLLASLTLLPTLARILLVEAKDDGPFEEDEPASLRSAPGRIAHFIFITIPVAILFLLRLLFREIARIGSWVTGLFTPIFDHALGALRRAHENLLDRTLRHKGTVILASLVLLALSLVIAGILGIELLPPLSQGEFSYEIELPEETAIDETGAILAALDNQILGSEGVAEIFAHAGGSFSSGFGRSSERENLAEIHVVIEDRTDRRLEHEVMDRIRSALDRIPGAQYKLKRPMAFSFRKPVEVEIYGHDLDTLVEASRNLASLMRGIEGLTNIKTSTELGNPEIQVRLDRVQLARLGLDLYETASSIRNMIKGDVVTEFSEGDREIDVRLRSDAPGRTSVPALEDLVLAEHDGIPVRLKSMGRVEHGYGPTGIQRIGQQRVAVIAADTQGIDLGGAVGAIRGIIAGMALPPELTVEITGQHREMAASFTSLALVIGLAVFLVYFVMASQFESLVVPFVILLTVPLGLVGVIWALFVTGFTVSVVVLIGVIMLAGIVVNNAIILIDRAIQLGGEGMGRIDAIREASIIRFRPILMTAATTILAMLPIALSRGEGAEIRSPMAVAVIGGLLASTPLTLFIIPAVYALIRGKGK